MERLRRSFPASIRSALNDLPKSLGETYEHTLLSIDEEKRDYAQRLFQCLTVSFRPLRVEELADILAVRFDVKATPRFNADWRPMDAEEAVLSACSSLVAVVDVGGSRVVQISHFSVREFLTSERLATAENRLSCYHILPGRAHSILSQACLSVLLQLGDKADKDTTNRFPLASYAARHWFDHARFQSISPHMLDMAMRLFDPVEPHFAAWVWLYDIDHHWMEPMSGIHPTKPDAVPLYYAVLCGLRDLVERLLKTGQYDANSRGTDHRNMEMPMSRNCCLSMAQT